MRVQVNCQDLILRIRAQFWPVEFAVKPILMCPDPFDVKLMDSTA